MEGPGEEPDTVYGATDAIAFYRSEKAAVGVIVLPLLERIDLFPSLRHLPDFDDLLDQSLGYWNATPDVSWLRGVVRNKLDDVVYRAKFGFSGLAEYDQFLGRVVHAVKPMAGSRKSDSGWNIW